MRRWSLEIKVGLMVAIAVVFFAFLLLNAADWPWGGGDREFTICFQFVNDIQEGAAVYLAGVPIGKVRHLRLVPAGVEIDISISDAGQPLREGSWASITMLGLVGENVLFLENGPQGNPPLEEGTRIQGQDPANVMETVNELGNVVKQSTLLLQDVQATLQRQDEQVTSLIRDIGQLTQQTSQTLTEMERNTNRLINTLDSTISARDRQLETLLTESTRWLSQTQKNSSSLMAQLEYTSAKLTEFVDGNEAQVQETLDDFATAAESLRTLALQVREQSQQVEQQLDDVLNGTDDLIAEMRPQMQTLLTSFGEIAEQLDPFVRSMQQIVTSIEEGEGSLPRLLNEGTALDMVENTLRETQTTLGEVRYLTQTVSEKANPEFEIGWDYELRYRMLANQLQNEAHLQIRTGGPWDYRIGLRARGDALGLNLQVGYRYHDLLLRAGLIHSRPALGLDYALLSDHLRFTLQGLELTAPTPRLAAEGAIQIVPHWELVAGGEVPIGDGWPREDWEFQLGLKVGY